MVSRRQFLGSAAAATAIIGFNPSTQSWATTARADSGMHRVPWLEGELVTALEAREALSTDTGNQVFRTPRAILRPASARDIAKMVRFCRRFRIKVAARGQGHTTFGQSLATLMIDMSTLNTVHEVVQGEADVDAGVLWKDLVTETVATGQTPPNLTDFTGLSIGGTLSVGGISGVPDSGAQVDDVYELEVVTGQGRIVRCSEDHHRDLFLAVLGGLGQCGIITRAVVGLVPAYERARTFQLAYFDNTTFFADLRTLLARNELDDVFCLWMPGGPSGWTYVLNAITYYDSSSPPDDEHLLRELSYESDVGTVDETYQSSTLSADRIIDQIKAVGLWDDVMHPWFDVFLPGRSVESYVGEVLPTLTPEDVGSTGFMLLFAKRRARFTRPFFRVPDDEWIYLFDILTANEVPGHDPEFGERMLARNRELFEKARDVGGVRYPIGSIEFSSWDWARHYGPTYFAFKRLQRKFDPSGILTPGVDV